MKQIKQVKKEKDNYLKTTFRFPVFIAVVDIVIVGIAMAIYAADPRSITNKGMARLMAQAATILVTMSPPIMLLTVGMAMKHVKRYPNGSEFYKKAPMLLSLLVWGCQTLYTFGLI